MGKSCANERNESSLSNCRVQPALSIKEGRGDFRKNPSLRVREDWWVFEKKLKAKGKNCWFFERNRKKNILRLIKDRWSFEKQKPRFSKEKEKRGFIITVTLGTIRRVQRRFDPSLCGNPQDFPQSASCRHQR